MGLPYKLKCVESTHRTLPTAADAENEINQLNDTIDNIRVVPNSQHLSPGVNKMKAQNMSEPWNQRRDSNMNPRLN